TARSGIVVFEKETINLQLVEQRIGDVVVASRSDPRRAEVAAAHVCANRHAGRFPGERGVEDANVGQVLASPVAAELSHIIALLWIVEVREARVIELQIRAS